MDGAANNYGPVPRETRTLTNIAVYSYPAGASDYQLLRRYDLVHDYSTYTDAPKCLTNCGTASPGYGTDPDFRKLTLNSITRVGNDGTSVLPTLTFGYTTTCCSNPKGFPDNNYNRLVTVTNNQGGTATFTYENIGIAQGYDSTFKNNRRLIQKVTDAGAGQTYTWSYVYTSPKPNECGSLCSIGSDNPNSAILYWNSFFSTTDYSSWLAVAARKEFRGHDHSVETDPNGTQTTHYFYQGFANQGPGGDPNCTYPKDSHGNALKGIAILTDPCFQQLRSREALVGREYDTVVAGAAAIGSPLLKETQHRFTVSFLGTVLDGTNGNGANTFTDTDGVTKVRYSMTGLWRAFRAESQMIETAWEGGAGLSKTTNYTYDGYGNQSQVDEYDTANALYRTTRHTFGSHTDAAAYIVDREAVKPRRSRTREPRQIGAGELRQCTASYSRGSGHRTNMKPDQNSRKRPIKERK